MNDLLNTINWNEKTNVVDSLLQHSHSLNIPLDAGLEAEVTKISTIESSFVLKVWNKSSKPQVQYQYKLLKAFYHQGLSVSEPLGWGVDKDNNQVLLTSYDGTPIVKVNGSVLQQLAKQLLQIHRYSLADLDETVLQQHDFVRYFYPSIDEHPDLKNLLIPLVESSNIRQECVIHGDYNLGNILEFEGKYTIIDWTNGQLGDPRYDIAWSIVLIRIYVGPRYGSVYHSAFLAESDYSKDELELFEALACLRWLLLYRIADLPNGKNTLARVRSILKNNIYLSENLL